MVSIFSASAKDSSSTKRSSGVNLMVISVAHLAAQKSLVAVQRRDDLLGILAAQRLAIDRGIAHVGRRLDLGDGHRDAVQIGIADFVAAQEFRPAHGAAPRPRATGAAKGPEFAAVRDGSVAVAAVAADDGLTGHANDAHSARWMVSTSKHSMTSPFCMSW